MNPTGDAPTVYPSVYWGCHYGKCTPGFAPVPAGSSQFAGVNTGVAMSFPSGGNWDAAYDIWFDPTARTDGQNTGAEVMVWLNHSGPPTTAQPWLEAFVTRHHQLVTSSARRRAVRGLMINRTATLDSYHLKYRILCLG